MVIMMGIYVCWMEYGGNRWAEILSRPSYGTAGVCRARPAAVLIT